MLRQATERAKTPLALIVRLRDDRDAGPCILENHAPAGVHDHDLDHVARARRREGRRGDKLTQALVPSEWEGSAIDHDGAAADDLR